MSTLRRVLLVLVATGVLAGAGAGVYAARRRPHAKPQPHRDAIVVPVPRATAPLVVDGETGDPAWLSPPGPARTGAFRFGDGTTGRPYSGARMMWRGGDFYVALYAADEDIRTRVDQPDGPLWLDDSFRMTFRKDGVEYAVEVSPKCVVSDGKRQGEHGAFDYRWSSGVRVGCDTDGTINDPHDMDEEWVVEAAVPLAAVGVKPEPGASFELEIQRCDTPKASPRVCVFWGKAHPRRIVLQ